MDYEKEVIIFLAKEENIKFALEIAEKIQAVKIQVQMKFWTKLWKEVEKRIVENHLDNWSVSISDEKDMSPRHSGVIISQNRENNYINFFLAHEDGRLWYGIKWENNEMSIPLDLPEVTTVENDLNTDKAREFKKVEYKPNKIYTWAWTDYYINDSSTLQMIASKDSLAIEMATFLWDFFESKRDMVEKANAAIAENIG